MWNVKDLPQIKYILQIKFSIYYSGIVSLQFIFIFPLIPAKVVRFKFQQSMLSKVVSEELLYFLVSDHTMLGLLTRTSKTFSFKTIKTESTCKHIFMFLYRKRNILFMFQRICPSYICRRMNVALTRAKNHLVIVGNKRNLNRNRLWSKVLGHCSGMYYF